MDQGETHTFWVLSSFPDSNDKSVIQANIKKDELCCANIIYETVKVPLACCTRLSVRGSANVTNNSANMYSARVAKSPSHIMNSMKLVIPLHLIS